MKICSENNYSRIDSTARYTIYGGKGGYLYRYATRAFNI